MSPTLSATARARAALRGAGLSPDTPLEPALSNANEAWLAADFVLRVNYRGDLGRLAREAQIAAHLHPDVRYPGVLDHGDDGQIEWILVRRVPGTQLGRAWPDLRVARRETAARELAAALRALHRTRADDLPDDGSLAPPHTLPLAPLFELLSKVSPILGPELCERTEDFVRSRWDAFDSDNQGLVHGDPHLENVLWHDGHISALIDLEWSRWSWVEVDLEILLDFCRQPHRFVSEDYEDRARAEDYEGVPAWLRQEYPAWFEHPRRDDRLAVLDVSRALGLLEEYRPTGPRDPDDPHDRRNDLWAMVGETPT